MSSYRTAFTNHLAISNAANRIRKSPNEKVDKLQKSMEKRFSFFLENRDWEQALRILMLNLQSNKNASIEKRASKSVVTPDHFQRLLQFDMMTRTSSSSSPVNSSSSSSPTALAYFIRDQALSDDIPNSPQLYSAIVHNFCQAHRNPKEALEVAIEGHARWRFDEEEKKEMGMTILRQCAKQKNCWSIACEAVDALLSSSSSPSLRSSSSSFLSPSTSAGSNKVIINNLLGEAAFRSGMWKSVVGGAPGGQNHSTTSSTELDEAEATKEVQEKEEEEDESKIINLWKACFSAAKEGQTAVALSIFEDQILPAASHNSNSNNTDEKNISTNALHQLLNCLGAEGNWRKATSVMTAWITTLKRSEITPTASNLFFSSFPSPFNIDIDINIDETSATNNSDNKNNNNNTNGSSATITVIEAFETATSTFHEWMAQETELFTPPPLTCALMVGFWHQLYFLKKNQKKNASNALTLDDESPDFVENAICLLKRFTVDEIIRETRGRHSFMGKGSKNYQHPILAQIDEASYKALQQARSILLSHEEYQPFLLLRHDENDDVYDNDTNGFSSSAFLQFPSPSYDRILHHKELFAHRAKQWKQRRDEMALGTRSPFSRPSRQDYFPAFGSDSNLGLNDVVDDENDLRRAMEAGRAIGQHSYDGADVTSQRDGSVSSGREGVYSMQSDKKKDAGSLFEDPRPGPFGQNEKLNGWEYYKMGGQVIYPGSKTSKVASPMHSLAPRRMKNLKKPDRTWSQSTPRAMSKSISKNYKWGKSV